MQQTRTIQNSSLCCQDSLGNNQPACIHVVITNSDCNTLMHFLKLGILSRLPAVYTVTNVHWPFCPPLFFGILETLRKVGFDAR